MITLEIDKMSRKEKLQTMEVLWSDLSNDDAGLVSPSWHNDALKEAERKVLAGAEQPVDWKTAKRELRKRFE